MYSKEQATSIRQEFWTTFGQFMSLTPGAEGNRINWINYKTGIKHLYFKMEIDKKSATIAIEMAHPDPGVQALMFEQFEVYRKVLESELEEEWTWLLHTKNDYQKTVSRIYISIPDVSVFRKEDWPLMGNFFKTRLVRLDEFWSSAKYGFDLFK